MPFSIRVIILLLFLAYAPGQNARADIPTSRTGESYNDTEKKAFNVKWKVSLGTGIEYSDNLYHLSDDQKRDLKIGDEKDTAGGRFDDMESESDLIFKPRFGLKAKFPALFGEDIRIGSRVQYNAHAKNDARNHPEVKLEINQPVTESDHVRLEWEYIHSFFKKNYFSGFNDANENGNITREERIYSPATYDAYEAIISYNHRILKNKNNVISKWDIEPFGGWERRTYNQAFINRDRMVAIGGMTTQLEFLSRFGLTATYRFEKITSPGYQELVLYDETHHSIDANGDGEIRSNAALVTAIDRSCVRHSIGIRPWVELTDDCLLFAGYTWRVSDYSSDNYLDVEHYHQRFYRTQLTAGAAYEFSKAWAAKVDYTRTTEDGYEEGEDYLENRVRVSLKYNLGI